MKKQEIILLQRVATLNEFIHMIKQNIFPLCIYLNDNEKEQFRNNIEIENKDLINELYSVFHLKNYLYLDGNVLRKKIELGQVYVNKFLDNSEKQRNVRFIAPAFGHDLDCPKIVFRKTPRLLFKKMDHFSLDVKYEGQEILGLCWRLAYDDKEQKILLKRKIK